MEQFFYSNKKLTSSFVKRIGVEGFFDALFFLETAHRIKPDNNCLSLILKNLEQSIRYGTHELPTGLMYDLEYFEELVIKFKYYFKQIGKSEKWSLFKKNCLDLLRHLKYFEKNKLDCIDFEEDVSKTNIEELVDSV